MVFGWNLRGQAALLFVKPGKREGKPKESPGGSEIRCGLSFGAPMSPALNNHNTIL
jgi:hypothetical protein